MKKIQHTMKPIQNSRAWPGVKGSTPPQEYLVRQERALWMRENPTVAEALLWRELSRKQLGAKFRRQQLIHFYIVDFYCVELGLVIEIDGEVHSEQQEYDHERDTVLRDSGCTIIRFSNDDIINSIARCLTLIRISIAALKSPSGDLGV